MLRNPLLSIAKTLGTIAREHTTMMKNFRDVFLSHAGKDKEEFINPLIKLLEQREISYWLDEAELGWGKSLLKLISEGIEKSKYVIVFISDNFLDRPWPEAELRSALSKKSRQEI